MEIAANRALVKRVAACLAASFLVLHAPAGTPRPSEASPNLDTLPLARGLAIRAGLGRQVELLVRPVAGETWAGIARAYASGRGASGTIAHLNGTEAPPPDRDARIPLSLLNDDYRTLVLLNLFPDDRIELGEWVHVARSGRLPTPDEGLWQVAEWFAGDGRKFREIARWNGLGSPELSVGQTVRVPAGLLHHAFLPGQASDDGALAFSEDGQGPFGGYRLKPGEALYSAVVMRFTGRTDPDDVNAVAQELAARSGIVDVTDIPVGFRVRIPFDLLEPEFLPAGHPRRREAEAARKEMAEELHREPVRPAGRGLEGVLVILDPGHGGRDAGTTNHGIREHDHVYDVACRLKAVLESETAARVVMTLEEPGVGFRPSAGDHVEASREGTLLTDPPFRAREEGESSIGVNLRWYLANSILRKAGRAGTPQDRVVFLSLHADSRHPSLRGLMVYVPGQRFRRGTQGQSGEGYERFREVREAPTVHFARRDLVRSEAVSRRLATAIVEAFHKDELPVQPFHPVRDRVIRGRRTWLPAVLRGNAVPAKALVEMVNLSNTQDAALLGSSRERSRLARALARALESYFDGSLPGSARSAVSPP